MAKQPQKPTMTEAVSAAMVNLLGILTPKYAKANMSWEEVEEELRKECLSHLQASFKGTFALADRFPDNDDLTCNYVVVLAHDVVEVSIRDARTQSHMKALGYAEG